LNSQLCQLFTIARRAQLRKGGVCVTAEKLCHEVVRRYDERLAAIYFQ
jgi:hypothetical protein